MTSRGGIVLTLPVTARSDGGLDVAVAGPPREIAGYPIRIKEVGLRLRGTIRRKVKRVVRRHALLTNPRSCGPATTVLDITPHELASTIVTRTNAFAITGC